MSRDPAQNLQSAIFRYLLRTGVAVIAIYLLAATFLFVFQRSFIYLPRSFHTSLADVGLTGTTEEAITTADGVHIMAWYSPAPAGMPTVVLFHGNGGFISAFADRIHRGQEKGYGVMLVEYRGYSGLAGTPTEEGLYADGRAALDWLAAHGVPSTATFLYGESLGSGVAVKLATERRVAGVILESPYTSAAAVGETQYWMFPVSWLIWDRYDSFSRIKDIRAPLLIMHGGADQVIPISQGRELFEAALPPKRGYFPAAAHHVDLIDYGGAYQTDRFIEIYWPGLSRR
jgi:fermentation-respiration switch protein FrsA (DUF1100 family)